MNLYVTSTVVTFHINKGFGEDYFVQKRQKMFKRLSQTNLRSGMGIEYGHPEEKIRQEYRQYQAQSIDISNM